MKKLILILIFIMIGIYSVCQATPWQDYDLCCDVGTAPDDADDFMINDTSDTTADADGTLKRVPWTKVQPRDTDLTSIAALSTSAYGRALLTLAAAAAANGKIIIGNGTDTPVMANITETGDALTISNGPGTINFVPHANLETLVDASANVLSLLGAANYAAMKTLLDIGRFFEGVTVAALTVGDPSPAVEPNKLYDTTGATTITVTDFVDADGDHTDFDDGDTFGVIVNSADFTIDFSSNANIEGNANTDFTGSASEIVLLIFTYRTDGWICTNYNMGFSDPTTFAIKGQKINTSTYSTDETLSATDVLGGVIYVTGEATLTVPALVENGSFSVITIGAVAVSIDPNGSDKLWLDGTALDNGDKITNLSTAGDIAVCTYYSADGWYCATNGWSDGG